MIVFIFPHKKLAYACGQILILSVLYCLLFLGFTLPLQAQDNSLNRVTASERSDGQGHVVRFHMDEPVDSFEVYQPSVDLVQMTLYGRHVDTSSIVLPETSEAFDEVSFYDVPLGIGVDIYIPEKESYKGNAYRDADSDDMLLGLTETDKTELEYLTKDMEPIIWSSFTISEESLLSGEPGSETTGNTDPPYQSAKEKYKFDTIVIDPGHGGHDPGSIGYRNVKEKDIVLKIAKKVGGYIKENIPDVEIVYTREDDTFLELEERGRIANEAEGDLFVSIHCNSHSSRRPYGTELFFLGLERSERALEVMKQENRVVRSNNETEQKELSQEELLVYELANSSYIASSERIAGMMEYQFDERAQRHSRGVKQGRFVVLFHASMPAVLVETGFISNPSEARYLTSERGQAYIASAIYRAIKDYKNGETNPKHSESR